MSDSLSRLDWSHVRSFLAVAETGSLSGAAARLGTSQPTVGRQVHAMEATLGAPLFVRQRRGMTLTGAGEALIAPARAMAGAAAELARAAEGQDAGLAGTVRITASVFMSHHVLPAAIAALRRVAPDISVELVASDATDNLLFHEADIAVRMFRPEQLDIVAGHVGDLELGLYGATAYLDRAGRPRTAEELMDHDLVGYDRNEAIIRGMRDAGWSVGRDFFPVRCDMQSAYWELVRAGCGIGFGQVTVAARDGRVERVLPDLAIPPLPVWLAAREAAHRTPRVGVVWRHLRGALVAAVS